MTRTCLAVCFCLVFFLSHQESASAEDAMQAVDLRSIKVGGEIGRRIDVTLANNLLVLDVDHDFLAPFKTPPDKRSGAYVGLGKLIDAAARLAAYSGDPRALALKRHLVAAAIAAQEADGYIGTFPPARRLWSLWDIHEMNYLVYGLTMDHRTFGEEPSLAAARKLADYILNRWAVEPPKRPSPWGITLYMGVTGVENSMLAIYQETGDPRYLNFVTRTRELANWDAHIVAGRHGDIEGHVYAHLCRCVAQLRLDRLQPNPGLLKPSRDALDFILNGNGMTITGECGESECWTNTQEGGVGLGESCASAYLVRWLDELLRMEGKSIYGDLMERLIYNGLFAAQSPDGRHIRYYTAMDAPRTYYKGDTFCCPNNYRRIVSELPLFVCCRCAGGVAINLYTQSEINLPLASDLNLCVRQETDYPSSGHVLIRVDPSRPASFPLRLRIPHWCDAPRVMLNGKGTDQAARPGEFFIINRQWQAGDQVELDLPMSFRLVAGRAAQIGRVAIMHGPQVFCLSRARNKILANVDLRWLVLDPTSIEGPFKDDAVRPGGIVCHVKAWGPGVFYPSKSGKLPLELTEFPDPSGELTYFKIPDPSAPENKNDELLVNAASAK